jgi:hypothetical protein
VLPRLVLLILCQFVSLFASLLVLFIIYASFVYLFLELFIIFLLLCIYVFLYSVHVSRLVILRLYKSPAEVLLGFDIDSCCVGYDGTDVWCQERFRRALTKRYNLVNIRYASWVLPFNFISFIQFNNIFICFQFICLLFNLVLLFPSDSISLVLFGLVIIRSVLSSIVTTRIVPYSLFYYFIIILLFFSSYSRLVVDH